MTAHDSPREQEGYPGIAHDWLQLVKRAEAVEAENARLRDGLRQLIDCKGSFKGTVSERGGDPAVCTKCEAQARALLSGEDGAATCQCPAGSYNRGSVHEPYCPLAEDGAA